MIHTLQPGQVVTVTRVIPESKLVEIGLNDLRLLFSRESLKRHGAMVSAA